MKLDKIDLKILSELQSNARITNQKLADRVSLSASACLTRVKRLETDGVIQEYNAKIELDLITPYVEAFAEITLENHSISDFQGFDKAIDSIDEIIESYKISGTYDYLLKFVCTDVKSYNLLTDNMIESGIGIEKLKTLVILSNTKKTSGYPIDLLLQGKRPS